MIRGRPWKRKPRGHVHPFLSGDSLEHRESDVVVRHDHDVHRAIETAPEYRIGGEYPFHLELLLVREKVRCRRQDPFLLVSEQTLLGSVRVDAGERKTGTRGPPTTVLSDAMIIVTSGTPQRSLRNSVWPGNS